MFANKVHKSLSLSQVAYIPMPINEADYKGRAVALAFSARVGESQSGMNSKRNAAGIVILDSGNKLVFSEGLLSRGGDDSHSEVLLLVRFLLQKLTMPKINTRTNYEFILKNIQNLLAYKIILFTERAPCNIKIVNKNALAKIQNQDEKFFAQITCEFLLREIASKEVDMEVYFSVPNSYGELIDATMGILLPFVQEALETTHMFPSIRRCIFYEETKEEYISKNVVLIPAKVAVEPAPEKSHVQPPQSNQERGSKLQILSQFEIARERNSQSISTINPNPLLDGIKSQIAQLSQSGIQQLMQWMRSIEQEEEEELPSVLKLQQKQ